MRLSTTLLLAVFMLFHAAAQAQPDLISAEFDGAWVGEPERISGANLSPSTAPPVKKKLRVDINGAKGIISEWKTDHWQRFWGIRNVVFTVASVETNAVMYQTVSGTDNDCAWVETWNLNLTKLDSNTVKAYYYRTVNNHDCEFKEERELVWTVAGSMILKKYKD
ncbi:hypothetical protein [Methylophilus luteus]|uniref:Uncharacterized protein n=1 Tax=Methylophilus luteus TaxID=640108 RepID=A0ABW3F3S7_9PROT